jgi:hypothetical protein
LGWKGIGDSLKQEPKIFTSIEIKVFCDKLRSLESVNVWVGDWVLGEDLVLATRNRWRLEKKLGFGLGLKIKVQDLIVIVSSNLV